MASDYGYADISGLQVVAASDYSVISNGAYHTGVVDANITLGEQMVNEYCGQTFTGTIPDGVEASTLLIAKKFMHNLMVDDGHAEERIKATEFIDPVIEELLYEHKESFDFDVLVTDNKYDT